MSTTQKYTKVAVILHWLIAFGIGLNIILAITNDYFSDATARIMIDLHKSIGITVLGLVMLRIIWRLTHTPPPFPPEYKAWETLAAHSAHYALYGLIILMPVTGWVHDSAFSQAAEHPLILFWVIPWFRLSFIANMDPATKHYVHELFGTIHTLLSYALYGVMAAHILGALKHQFIDKHPEIQRMWR
ncbi:MAG: cytochrome B [Acidocella sp. 20-57-95]|nr:MAG: cytochrome B [Acidocella sp. 20-57-95]OYV61919.1 MAG: cytochrome B [Acidocella sp. 21-58-7]HQT63667.1 cytochrome b [Acidocella sp.]HQU04176.1 cytochrome b [Acidocella sp.]